MAESEGASLLWPSDPPVDPSASGGEETQELQPFVSKPPEVPVTPDLFRMADNSPACYGSIKFLVRETNTLSPFICTRAPAPEQLETEAINMKKWLTTQWRLTPPSVVISVTGGAQAFTMSPLLERLFAVGLVRAAQNSNAWIITGGLDSGVMDYVGRAVKVSRIKIPTIALASYQMVTHKDQLQVRGATVNYKKLIPNSGSSAALETNHTHFILVDGGPVAPGKVGWGVEIAFRAALENAVATDTSTSPPTIRPQVLIVVQGGPGTLKTVMETSRLGFPVVLVEGSGGASDAICNAWRNQQQEKLPVAERGALLPVAANMNTPDLKTILQAGEQFQNLTLYNPKDPSQQFDTAVLRAILENKQRQISFRDKLILTVQWKRIDLFKEVLAQPDASTKDPEAVLSALDTALEKALILNLPEFYRALISNGARISKINLVTIYSDPTVRQIFATLSPSSTFKDPNMLIAGKQASQLTLGVGMQSRLPKIVPDLLRHLHPFDDYVQNISIQEVNYADLLVWAGLLGRTELCRAIWEGSTYPIHSALMVSKIFRHLSTQWVDQSAVYIEAGASFEALALGVLDQIALFAEATQVLTKEWQVMGSSATALRLAADSESKIFMAHRHCQRVLDRQFYSYQDAKISSSTRYITILLCVLCPFFLFVNVPFFQSPLQKKKATKQPSTAGSPPPLPSGMASRSESFDPTNPNDPFTPYEKCQSFFNLPIVKLVSNTFFYGIFLALLSLVASAKVEFSLHWSEYALGLWIFALILDEVVQYLEDPIQHFAPTSNKLDLLLLSSFVVYYILRLYSVGTEDHNTRQGSLEVLQMNIVICYLRLMQVFSVNYYLGPLLIMITKMTGDIIRFFSLFVLFFIGFQISFISVTREAYWLNDGGVNDISEDAWEDAYPEGTMSIAYWAFVGEWSNAFPILERSNVGVPLMAVFLLLGQILLQNLLIAMMADTYGSIRDNSDKEWKYYRYFIVHEYRVANALPPPLNLIGLVQEVLMKMFNVCRDQPAPEFRASEENYDLISKMTAYRDDLVAMGEQGTVDTRIGGLEEQLATLIQDRRDQFDAIMQELANIQKQRAGPA